MTKKCPGFEPGTFGLKLPMLCHLLAEHLGLLHLCILSCATVKKYGGHTIDMPTQWTQKRYWSWHLVWYLNPLNEKNTSKGTPKKLDTSLHLINYNTVILARKYITRLLRPDVKINKVSRFVHDNTVGRALTASVKSSSFWILACTLFRPFGKLQLQWFYYLLIAYFLVLLINYLLL